MATRREGRGCGDASPSAQRPPAAPRGPSASGEAASPPVLSLSHFCTKPFLCFGDVRLGASRTLPLALDNPNDEEASVTLPRFPAAARGFDVQPRAFVLQPKEKVVISVNWTPLKEGRVREVVTFLVNDVLKHEVILLGNAEEPKKKKRSLWDTIKKKKVSASSSQERISNIQNVNKTFSVSQKVNRVRSPLQACENVGRSASCSPPGNSSLILKENKVSISPISPIFGECRGETCLPLSVRRSTTYSSLHAPDNRGLLNLEDANISTDFNFNEQVITETSFNSVNDSNGQVEEDNKLILTPNDSSPLNITQSQGNFLSPDSFVNNNRKANNELELVTCISSAMFMKDNSRPMPLESKTVHEVYRTILSPESFINDNYGLKQELESESVNPILSPHQFVKDNMAYICISQQTCELPPLSNGNSQASQSPQRQREKVVVPCIPECSKSPKAVFEGPQTLEMKPKCYSFTKQNQPKFSAVEAISDYSHNSQVKRRPILSATVTKLKPTGMRGSQPETNKPKAKRCLRGLAGEGEAVTDSQEEGDAFHSSLPVIDPVRSKPKSCREVGTPSKTAFLARKRKSEGHREDGGVTLTVTEPTGAQEVKRIHLSPVESKTATVKTRTVVTPISKLRSSREKLQLKKKTDSLYKTPNCKTNKRKKRIVPVAQSNLTFIKPLKTDIPRHPMPFAAKNMFYDERWKEKQQQGFTWWLNFILTPEDFTVKTSISEVNAATLLLGVESQHKLSVPRAPTKDEMSLRAYTARCRLNRLRRAACRLFTSERMVKAIKKLEIEIEARRLTVRKDRHLWKDVGERQKVLNWLLSYNPLWLRIGLEVFEQNNLWDRRNLNNNLDFIYQELETHHDKPINVTGLDMYMAFEDFKKASKAKNMITEGGVSILAVYGELIALEDNSDVMGMAMFILNRLLWNPDIAAEYRHPTVPHLYRDGHEEALSKFTLKKLLLLVCFLDYAKNCRLIDHDPCLFCKDAEFKTSKEILLALSRDFLSGEGDLSRHLSLLGLPVTHIQMPFDEFDFAVTNLAVDLQCGVRLVRTMELLTQNWDLSKKLRVPAISRLQKMHNVDIALGVLKSRGIQLDDEHGSAILSKDIVDRHREKTLALLWKIAFAFQVDGSLDLDQIREEIDFLKLTWRMKRTMSALSCPSDAVPSKRKDRRSNSCEQHSDSVRLLMDWVNAVCAFYNKKVENFTVSFSDGRVLCYLIHHYHPCYVPLDSICQRTTQTVECAQTGSVVLNSSSESSDSCLDVSLKAFDHVENTSELYKELLDNEKKNFQLVRSAVRDLGGIPAMVHHSDMSNTIPDEKVVITYLSFLCARLLDLRREARAARLIQTAWRKFKLKADRKHHQERDRAARIIQSAVSSFLTRRQLKKKVHAALVIQKYWRRFSEQRKLLMLKKEKLEKAKTQSALVIQKYWRRYSTRKHFLKLKYYSIILQSRIRMIIAVAAYKRYLWATVTIQRHWRACLRRKQDQQRYKMLKSSSLVIQSVFRRWKRRQTQLRMKAAIVLQRAFREWHARKRAKEEESAVVIQSWYRMHKELRKYTRIRSCVVTIQTWFRAFEARGSYRRRREAVLTIQRYYRAHLAGRTARTRYLQKQAAAIRLQAAVRGMQARRLRRQIGAARVLQSYWRMRQERFQFLSLKKTVIKLQAHIRKYQQVQKYQKMKKATLVIQVHFRAYIAAQKVLASYQKTRSAVVVLQSACRGMQARKMFNHILTSIIKIQSCYRAYISRKKFLSLKRAVVKLQSLVKMKQTRERYLRVRAAVLCIQRWYRSRRMAALVRGGYRQARESCIRLQAGVRGHLVRKQMRLQREAAVCLQSYFRMRQTRLYYLKVYKAATVIQKGYRAYKARVGHRRNLEVTRAVTCLQAAYRGYRVRQLVMQQSTAALKIQAAFRCYSARMKYQSVLRSAVTIQRWYRGHQAACDLRTRFLKTRVAVISLQSAYRGWRVRKQMRRECQAAVTIQSAFRMAKARKRFRVLQAAVLVIQQHQRAWSAGKKQRRDYIELRRAALMLQAAWKRKTRRRIQQQHACAVVIQSYYRMYVQQKKWKTTRRAARLIQTYYRASSIARKQRHVYLQTKAAIVVLQAAYRCMRERRNEVRERNKAAVTIQSKYRAYKNNQRNATYRASALVIQRWYRNIKTASHQRKEYLNLKKTAIKIQAIYRGVRVRRHIQHMHVAATFIKAMFKMHQAKIRYRRMRAAAVVIQVSYRAYCQGIAPRAEYLAVLKAATLLQASVRGARVRQTLRKMQAAAALIQSHYRRHRQQTRFRQLKKVTESVQRRYRAVKAGKAECQRYNNFRGSVIRIQAGFRGMRVRRHLKVMHLAATLIQRRFRTLMLRRRFLSLRRTALWVQRKYRTNVCARPHLELLRSQKAAVNIQSSYRSWAGRGKTDEMPRAAALTQAAFRRHVAHVRYQALTHTSTLIQQHCRANRAAESQRETYVGQRHSAVVIQAAYGGMKARQLLREGHRAAVVIQSTYRMYRQYFSYRQLQWAARVIQERYRANKKKALQHSAPPKAATCIPTGSQGTVVGKVGEGQRQAAASVQKHLEAFATRKRCCLRLRAPVVLVQRRYRVLLAERATCIQASFRGVQPTPVAATRTRALYTMHRATADYQAEQTAAVVTQSRCRSRTGARLEREPFSAAQKSVRALPAALRGGRVRRKAENLPGERMRAAAEQPPRRGCGTGSPRAALPGSAAQTRRRGDASLAAPARGAQRPCPRRAAGAVEEAARRRVQGSLEPRRCAAPHAQACRRVTGSRGRAVRGKAAARPRSRAWRAREHVPRGGRAAVALQSHPRARVAATHHRRAYLQTRSSAALVHARLKGFPQKRRLQKTGDGALKIQAVWRSYKARQYVCKVKAACKIQAWYRCWKARREYLALLTAVKIIQGCFWTKLVRTRFLNVRASTVIIQRRWRATLSGRRTREHFLMMKRHRAACLIQARFRGYKARQLFQRQKLAALIIQRCVRAWESGRRERTKYVELKKHTVVVQALVRGWLVRKRVSEQRARVRLLRFTAAAWFHLCAVRIQRAHRRHQALKHAAEHVASVVCIQRWFRARLQLKRFMQICHSIIKIQHEVRERTRKQNRAASVIQEAVRRFLLRKKQEKFNKGIVKIQALWRGYSWRKKNDRTKIKAIRRRLEIINREVREENKLYKRTAFALGHLLTYKHLSAILEALRHLEVVTRLSPLCCENMAQSGAISKLFVLIRSCNRSVPCMEVISYAVQVLLNVAKFEKTACAVYGVDSCVETLLELLQIYREKPGDKVADKSGSIFTRTCCLLAVLLKTVAGASDVRNRSNVVDCVYSLYKHTARQHRVNTERVLYKQNKNSSISTPFIPETPVSTGLVSRLKPGWVLRRDNVDVTSPLQAVQMVMDALGIPY